MHNKLLLNAQTTVNVEILCKYCKYYIFISCLPSVLKLGSINIRFPMDFPFVHSSDLDQFTFTVSNPVLICHSMIPKFSSKNSIFLIAQSHWSLSFTANLWTHSNIKLCCKSKCHIIWNQFSHRNQSYQ